MYLLIPAAGIGKRMGGEQNKLLLTLWQKPLLAWTLQSAIAAEEIKWIGIIGQTHDFPAFRAIIEEYLPPDDVSKPIELILGGNTRQESVFNGLQALPPQAERVLIHDGARCLATPNLFNRCALALTQTRGLIAAVPVKDTIKIVDQEGWIQDTPERQNLWAAQTPQGFVVSVLRECHSRGLAEGWQVTDDAALLERCGIPVQILLGEETNLKITTPIDLAIAEFILHQRFRDA
jgi:2-C-methyl-D-erythritol 4-phosphate cytidylyltransferase